MKCFREVGKKPTWTRCTKWLEEGNTTYVDSSCDETVNRINSLDTCLLVAGDGTTEEESGSVHGSMRTAYAIYKKINFELNKYSI